MSETANGAKIVQAYRNHRPYLVDLAFRMLGDIGAAEDAVQDAFTRLLAADVGEITDERGWLIVVTSRLCLDRIRSVHVIADPPSWPLSASSYPARPRTGPDQVKSVPASRSARPFRPYLCPGHLRPAAQVRSQR